MIQVSRWPLQTPNFQDFCSFLITQGSYAKPRIFQFVKYWPGSLTLRSAIEKTNHLKALYHWSCRCLGSTKRGDFWCRLKTSACTLNVSSLFEPFVYNKIISVIFILWVSRQSRKNLQHTGDKLIVCYQSINTRYTIPIDYCRSPMGVSSALSINFMLNKSCAASGTLKLCWPPSNLHSNSHWPGSKGAKDK